MNLMNKSQHISLDLHGSKHEDAEILIDEFIIKNIDKKKIIVLNNKSIDQVIPIIACCNLSICNDTSFSHLSAALDVKTITLMADTPLIYGNYNTKMFPIIPDGESTVSHKTLGKDKINPKKIFDKFIDIIN